MASVYPRRDRKISEFTLNIYQNEYSNTLYNTLYLTLLRGCVIFCGRLVQG